MVTTEVPCPYLPDRMERKIITELAGSQANDMFELLSRAGALVELRSAFEAIGEKAKAQKCPGILGIIEEKKEFKEEEEPSKPILEAFNLGAGLRVEHYEIAAYRSAMAVAKSLRQSQVVELLRANLEQEVAMAKFIESSSAKVLRMVEAATRAMEEDGTGGARKGGARKRAAK